MRSRAAVNGVCSIGSVNIMPNSPIDTVMPKPTEKIWICCGRGGGGAARG